MTRTARRRTWALRACVLTMLCVLGGGLLTSASADVKTPPPPDSQTGWGNSGAILDKTTQGVRKAKIQFDLKLMTGFVWTHAVIEKPIDPKYIWTDSTSDIYVDSDPPGPPTGDFGVFPETTVKALAFGSVPVTVKVHVNQLPQNGFVEPFTVSIRWTGGHPRGDQYFYTEQPHLTGRVNIRLSDVTVDQIPVDVGPNCHTVQPATLAMTAASGYYKVSGTPDIPADLYVPYNGNGGTLKGAVDVPAFAGCHNGADDLDALLTAMVSGPGNCIVVHQLGKLVKYPPTLPPPDSGGSTPKPNTPLSPDCT